jgi:hypothetical protein
MVPPKIGVALLHFTATAGGTDKATLGASLSGESGNHSVMTGNQQKFL